MPPRRWLCCGTGPGDAGQALLRRRTGSPEPIGHPAANIPFAGAYLHGVIEVRQTAIFAAWLLSLRDRDAADRIVVRIRRLQLGNPGDVKSVGAGVSEMRVDHGPGFRVYFARRGTAIVVLLCGGPKGSQGRDIAHAQKLAREV